MKKLPYVKKFSTATRASGMPLNPTADHMGLDFFRARLPTGPESFSHRFEMNGESSTCRRRRQAPKNSSLHPRKGPLTGHPSVGQWLVERCDAPSANTSTTPSLWPARTDFRGAVVERIVDDRVDTASWWPGRTSVDTDRQKVSITTPRMRKTLRRIEKFTLTSK